MTSSSLAPAVQAIQTLIRKAYKMSHLTDAEIEQVLRETMPQPSNKSIDFFVSDFIGNRHLPEYVQIDGYSHSLRELLETCLELYETESTLPESPLRERLTELVDFWREKHTTGGIPWGDVAELLEVDCVGADSKANRVGVRPKGCGRRMSWQGNLEDKQQRIEPSVAARKGVLGADHNLSSVESAPAESASPKEDVADLLKEPK